MVLIEGKQYTPVAGGDKKLFIKLQSHNFMTKDFSRPPREK
jgi:hypothetical protein